MRPNGRAVPSATLVPRLPAANFLRRPARLLIALVLLFLSMKPAPAQTNAPASAAALSNIVARAVSAARAEFPKLQVSQIAVTLVDLRDAARPVRASHRGDARIYPASVIKLFYLAAAHRWLEDGRLTSSPELSRALSDMIVHSSNDATHYVIDLLTGTTSGPELPAAELQAWHDKRDAVNRHFAALGYTGINVNKKTWGDGPYGRETQAIKAFQPNRNLLTTDATARLMTEIVTRECVSNPRSCLMMSLLRRDLKPPKGKAPDGQSQFTGPALPGGAKLWSKAGWTSTTRHDCAYIELPDGRKFVLVTFTVDHANERGILHAVARKVVAELK